ncbi:unnamed protein product [Rangifer tarandus platyrhynchus]|uniref:Uncharacterized protein n=2 Tax=Rangifer tarandus platyrhynchus TaxID=3082113 RepID=A0ABN8ZTI9_RANTA|nr:unnamed protein product [Rangifer tarandus platyrhynchus]
MALGPQKVTAPERRSPGPRGAGVVGRLLHSPLLTVLGPGAGPWHLLGRRSAHNQNGCLPGGPQEGPPTLLGPVGGALTPDCTESATSRQSRPTPLCCPGLPFTDKLWFLSACTPGSLVREMRAPCFPFLLPPRPPPSMSQQGWGERSLSFCTHVLVSLGASTGFTRADLGSIPGRLAGGWFGLAVGFREDIL